MIRETATLLPWADIAQTYWDEGREDLAEAFLKSALHETAPINRVHRATRELHEAVARAARLSVQARVARIARAS